jgi:hypothetical protein
MRLAMPREVVKSANTVLTAELINNFYRHHFGKKNFNIVVRAKFLK